MRSMCSFNKYWPMENYVPGYTVGHRMITGVIKLDKVLSSWSFCCSRQTIKTKKSMSVTESGKLIQMLLPLSWKCSLQGGPTDPWRLKSASLWNPLRLGVDWTWWLASSKHNTTKWWDITSGLRLRKDCGFCYGRPFCSLSWLTQGSQLPAVSCLMERPARQGTDVTATLVNLETATPQLEPCTDRSPGQHLDSRRGRDCEPQGPS